MREFLSLALVIGCSPAASNSPVDAQTGAEGNETDSAVDTMLDANLDAQPPCATPGGNIRIEVDGYRGVLVHDSTGSQVGRIDGYTSPLEVAVPACGGVTLFSNGLYETFTNLVAGDVVIEDIGARLVPFEDAKLVVSVPVQNAFGYLATAGLCGSGQGTSTIPSPITLPYRSDCTNDTILVIPRGQFSDENVPFAYALFEGVSLAATAQAPLHVTSWQTEAPVHELAVHLGTPSAINCGARSRIGRHPFPGTSKTATAVTDHVFSIQYPEFGDRVDYDCFIQQGQTHRNIVIRANGAMPAAVSFGESQLLPVIENVVHDSSVRPTVSFSLSPNIAEEDLVRVDISGPGPTGFTSLRLYSPSGTRTVRVPELPPDLAIDYPVQTQVKVAIYDATHVSDYREVVRRPFSFFIFFGDMPVGTSRATELQLP